MWNIEFFNLQTSFELILSLHIELLQAFDSEKINLPHTRIKTLLDYVTRRSEKNWDLLKT